MRVFYEDLTVYEFYADDVFIDPKSGFRGLSYRPAYTRLNIGWLEAGKPYPTGPVDPAFMEKLEAVQGVQCMNIMLGLHECDLCPQGEGPESTGEIRIPGLDGVAYAAPFLIGHYVTAHGYRPPQVFTDAVLAVDLDAWVAARWPEVAFPWIPDDADRVEE